LRPSKVPCTAHGQAEALDSVSGALPYQLAHLGGSNMKKHWLAAPALALAVGLTSFAPVASAEEIFRLSDFFKMADANTDSMITRKEYVDAAGKTYDMMVARIKKMPAEKQKQLMKGDAMTKDGLSMFIDNFYKGA
jgi:hypothetical protein